MIFSELNCSLGFTAIWKVFPQLKRQVKPLFGNIQWIGLKHALPDTLQFMEQYVYTNDRIQTPFAIWHHLELRYSSLGNKMLMQLVRSVYLFLHIPFFSIERNMDFDSGGQGYAMELLISISRSVYPAGTYSPTAERLAKEKGVSTNTVRRALILLKSIGAVKSSRPLGSCVVPFMDSNKKKYF